MIFFQKMKIQNNAQFFSKNGYKYFKVSCHVLPLKAVLWFEKLRVNKSFEEGTLAVRKLQKSFFFTSFCAYFSLFFDILHPQRKTHELGPGYITMRSFSVQWYMTNEHIHLSCWPVDGQCVYISLPDCLFFRAHHPSRFCMITLSA